MLSYTSLLLILGILIAHFIVIERMARYRYVPLLFSLLAILSVPIWMQKFDGWFYIVKILSVWVPITIYAVIKASYPSSDRMKRWATIFAKASFFLLTLNILEASVKDLIQQNTLNGITGILLIVVLPLISKDNWNAINYKHQPFVIKANTPFFYIFLYSSWNVCFVYTVFPEYFFVVVISLLYCFIHVWFTKSPNLWFTFRTFTLGFILMLRANSYLVENHLDFGYLHNEAVGSIWGLVNLVLILGYAIYSYKGELKSSALGLGLNKTRA